MSERGVALVMALWTIVLLTVVAMGFAFATRFETAGTRNFRDATAAYYLAVSGYEEALAHLLSDPEPEVDFLDQDGIFHTDLTRPSVEGRRDSDDGSAVEIALSDEESRLNINTLSRSTIERLLERAGVAEDASAEILDSIEDWRDRDDLHRISGAEDDYYEDLAYASKDRDLDTPEELVLIRGFAPEYLQGGEGAPLASLITTWGSGRVNVNTAPAEVLELLGVNESTIEAVMKHRETGPYTTVHVSLPGGKGATASGTFRIEVRARGAGSPQAVRIMAVVSRKIGAEGPRIKTLYWRESIETWKDEDEGSGA